MKDKIEIETIIRDIINISKFYEEKQTDSDIERIIDIYIDSKINVTRSQYLEINNYMDEQISTFLYNRSERQKVQEYITGVSEKLIEKGNEQISGNSFKNFKEFIQYVTDYIKNHITTYSSMLTGIEETAKSQKKYTDQLDKAQKNLKNAEKQLKVVKEQLKNTHDTVDNLLPNLLTVLSILISIVIAVVIVYITVFLEPSESKVALVENILQARFAQYVLSVHMVGDLFFIMMFMIARLTNRSILMTCSHFEWKPKIKEEDKDKYSTIYHSFACADCCADCNFIKKLQRKSAYILYFNLLMFVLYAILYIWWILEYYVGNGRTTNKCFLYTNDFWFVISLAIICVLVSIAFIIYKCVNKKQISDS